MTKASRDAQGRKRVKRGKKKLDDEWPESIFHHVGSQSVSYLLSDQCEVLSRVFICVCVCMSLCLCVSPSKLRQCVGLCVCVSTSQESRVVGRHDSAAGAPEQLREMTQPREMTHPRTKVVLQSRQFSASSSTDCSAY